MPSADVQTQGLLDRFSVWQDYPTYPLKNGTEQCDGTDLGGKTCQTQGFIGGSLSCTKSCTFNTSACKSAPPDAGTDMGPADAGMDMGPADLGKDGQATTHPFPFSFQDQQFFSGVSASAPLTLACGTFTDLSITKHQEPAAIVNGCGKGTSTIQRVRLGGDGGTNGDVREGYRCSGSGTMNIVDSWLESTGSGTDHADTIQCYDPNNSPTAVMKITNTTIRAHNTAATAGIFVADSYALELHITNVLFWGGPYGLRFHTDGRPGSLYMNNVCFYGDGSSNHSFLSGPYLINPYPPTIVEWKNVNWCTIVNGQLVVHGPIAHP